MVSFVIIIVSLLDVPTSCQWYVQSTPLTTQICKDTNLTMQYFKNNANFVAIAHYYAQYMLSPVNQFNGPLFLKVFTGHLTTFDERTKKPLLKSDKAYKITTTNREDVQIAYNQLLATAETFFVLSNNVLPPNMIKLYSFIPISSQLLVIPSLMNSSLISIKNFGIHFYNYQFDLMDIL